MGEAIALARAAASDGEAPVGAVLVHNGQSIGAGRNRREARQDPLGHAEMEAIAAAARHLGSWRLIDTTLYATLEPCAMCAGAVVNARITRLVFGASDPKAGFCGSLGNLVEDARLNHRVRLTTGVRAEECGRILAAFFQGLRTQQDL